MRDPAPTTFPRRAPDQVMRLSRLGSLHQSRLSFMRVLTRRMAAETWRFTRPVFEVNAEGVGHAVYSATGPDHTYSLVAFAHDLPADKRSDRVIAEAWDATFCLFDGVPTADDITRLSQNVPLQEAGRISENELSLSRANRSVRLWAHVVDRLASGHQPDTDQITKVGYLMRTTAVYGSGKFGAADREKIADRPEMQVPFQAEMLSVYLTRTFVRDLVQHMANAKGGDQTATLDPAIARLLGIGNSTGLGMAPFVVNHPVLFNNWIMAREEAIARIRAVDTATAKEAATFRNLLNRSAVSVTNWRSDHPLQIEKLTTLRSDMETLIAHVDAADLTANAPWNRLYEWVEATLGEDAQELVASLILEPYPDLVDGLACCMADSNFDAFRIDGSMSIAATRTLLETSFGWANTVNWDAAKNCALKYAPRRLS